MMQSIGVIGAGTWGKNVIKTVYSLGARISVSDVRPENLEDVGCRHRDVNCVRNYHDILRSEIPGVVIATPADTHYGIAKEALECGKDVFIEKPMTLSSRDAKAIVELAEQKGRLVMVGHLLLYQKAMAYIKRCIASGDLGQLHSVHIQRLKLGRVRSCENVLWSFGVHDVAVLLHLLDAVPEQAQVFGQCVIQENVEDDVRVHMRFPGGVHSHIHMSWLWPQVVRNTTVIGQQGMLVYDEIEQRVMWHRKGVTPDLQCWDEGMHVVWEGEDDPLRTELLHFLECMETRKAPLSDGHSGLRVIEVLEQLSSQLGEKRELLRA